MKINHTLQYVGKTQDIIDIIDRLLLECCDIYLNTNPKGMMDEDSCENCGSFADEITTYEIVVKYKDKTIFSFYICVICAEKNNLLKE